MIQRTALGIMPELTGEKEKKRPGKMNKKSKG